MIRSNGVMLVHWPARRSFASSVPSSSVYWWVFGGRHRTFRTGVWHNSSVLVGNYTNTNNGVDDNETIKVYSSGGADPDGTQPSDLYVTIKVREDPAFCREGADIHVRAGTQPGQKVVLKKNGIKTRNSYLLGDQYVDFNVSIPTNLTQRQHKLIEEFGKEEEGEYGKCAAAGAS